MKKFLTLSIVILILFSLAIAPVSAVNYDDQVAPCYNNTIKTSTTFQISDDGVATATLDYIGYPNYATGATITCNIQKKVLWWWNDVDGASWTDEVTGFTNTVQHTFQLSSKGTYRLVYEYEIRGTAGDADIISDNIEDKYER